MTHDPGFLARVAATAQVLCDGLEPSAIDPNDAFHLKKVLRLRRGETLVLADGKGAYQLGSYTADDRLFEPTEPRAFVAAPKTRAGVAFVPTKRERPEWIVTKLVELGIDDIVACTSDRAVVTWEGERQAKHLRRFEQAAKEALCQSRSLHLPTVTVGGSARELAAAGAVLAHLDAPQPHAQFSMVVIGPEGGWSETELAAARETISLGSNVLRAETAAIAAGVLAVALRDGTLRAGNER